MKEFFRDYREDGSSFPEPSKENYYDLSKILRVTYEDYQTSETNSVNQVVSTTKVQGACTVQRLGLLQHNRYTSSFTASRDIVLAEYANASCFFRLF